MMFLKFQNRQGHPWLQEEKLGKKQCWGGGGCGGPWEQEKVVSDQTNQEQKDEREDI